MFPSPRLSLLSFSYAHFHYLKLNVYNRKIARISVSLLCWFPAAKSESRYVIFLLETPTPPKNVYISGVETFILDPNPTMFPSVPSR